MSKVNFVELRQKLNQQYTEEKLTIVEYINACKALDALEYRTKYNQRPERVEARKAYNQKRWAEIKEGRKTLKGLSE